MLSRILALCTSLWVVTTISTTLYSQTSSWEWIDSNFTDINVIGKRIFAQQYHLFFPHLTRQKYSDDNGKTWHSISIQGKPYYPYIDCPPDLRIIVRHPKYLLTVSNNLTWEGMTILYRSFTNGATWDTIALPKKWYLSHYYYIIDGVTLQDTSIFISMSKSFIAPNDANGVADGGFFYSRNHGITWDSLNNFQGTLKLWEKQITATSTSVLAISGMRTILRLSKGNSTWNSKPTKLHEKDTEEYLQGLTSNTQYFFVIGSNDRLINNPISKLWRGNADATEWKLLIEDDVIWGLCVKEQHLVVSTKKRGTLYSSNQGETWVSFNENNFLAGMTSLAISDDGWVYGSGSINGVRGVFRRKISP